MTLLNGKNITIKNYINGGKYYGTEVQFGTL